MAQHRPDQLTGGATAGLFEFIINKWRAAAAGNPFNFKTVYLLNGVWLAI